VDQVTTGSGQAAEDEELAHFGYRQQFVRSIRHFESFAVAFSFAAPVASIVHDVLGGVVQKIFLVFVCVSIFACGLVTNGRLIFSMARDRRRLPGRGARLRHHAGAAHPRRRAVHRVHDHARAAVRGYRAAVPIQPGQHQAQHVRQV
jgi:amino acid transporter